MNRRNNQSFFIALQKTDTAHIRTYSNEQRATSNEIISCCSQLKMKDTETYYPAHGIGKFFGLGENARNRAKQAREQRKKMDSAQQFRRHSIVSAVNDVLNSDASTVETATISSGSISAASNTSRSSSLFSGSMSPLDGSTRSDTQIKRRYRRRGSCTKYSLEYLEGISTKQQEQLQHPRTAPVASKASVSSTFSNLPRAPDLSNEKEQNLMSLLTIDQRPLTLRKNSCPVFTIDQRPIPTRPITSTKTKQQGRPSRSRKPERCLTEPTKRSTFQIQKDASPSLPFTPNMYGQNSSTDDLPDEEPHPAEHRRGRTRRKASMDSNSIQSPGLSSNNASRTSPKKKWSNSMSSPLSSPSVPNKWPKSTASCSTPSPRKPTHKLSSPVLPSPPFSKGESNEEQRPRRYSRRGSVTKYSIEAPEPFSSPQSQGGTPRSKWGPFSAGQQSSPTISSPSPTCRRPPTWELRERAKSATRADRTPTNSRRSCRARLETPSTPQLPPAFASLAAFKSPINSPRRLTTTNADIRQRQNQSKARRGSILDSLAQLDDVPNVLLLN